jgi:hypothetical protein
MTQDFKAQLIRQLSFMARSCESYDAGFQDEAIRVATSLRVLIHDTKRQKSLLSLLKARGIKLATSVEPRDTGRSAILHTMCTFTFTAGQGVSWGPGLNRDRIKTEMPLEDWWHQTIYIYGSVRLTRCSLILGAADKDGGAHVDPAVTVEYESLINEGGKGFFSVKYGSGAEQSIPIGNAHLIYIRQIGFEVLNSSELLALTR